MAIQAKYTASKGLVDTRKEGFATATLATTTAIVLTSTIKGDSRNENTFKIVCAAAADNDAANAEAVVKVAFTQTADAILCTVTPDSTPAGSITTAEVVEMINTGAVSGKNIVITDSLNLRTLQTASGGGAQVLANNGEVGTAGKTGTFLGAPTSEFRVQGIGLSADLETVKAGEFAITCIATSDTGSGEGTLQGKSFSIDSGNGAIRFVMQAGGLDVSGSDQNIDLTSHTQNPGQVATSVANAINALAGFSATAGGAGGAVVTVANAKTGLTDQKALGAGTSGFTFAITSEGAGAANGVINTTGVTIIGHNHGEAAAMSLGDLTENQAGTIKLIKQVHGGQGAFELSVTSHATSDPEKFTFNANGEQLALIWLGSKWNNVISRGNLNKNTATT